MVELGLKYTGAKSTKPETSYLVYEGIGYIYLDTDDWTDWVAFPSADNNSATWMFSKSNVYWKDSTTIKNPAVKNRI